MRTFLLLLSFLVALPLPASTLLLKNVHVIDPAKQQIWSGHLLLTGGKIHRLTTLPKTFKGEQRDLSGKYVLPALTDMHDHSTLNNPGPGGVIERLSTEQVAKRMLYAGVTAFLDLMADENEIFEFRNAQRKHPAKGATLYAAGPMLTCSNGHGTEFGPGHARTMDNAKEAKRQVDDLAKHKPDVIKIAYDHARDYKSMNRATLAAIVAAAKQHKLKTIVHIGTWQDARDAIEVGATVVTHLHESPMPDDIPALMVKHGTWEIPTLTYQSDLLEILENRSLLNAPLLKQMLPADLMEAYRKLDPKESYVANELTIQVKGREPFRAAMKKLSSGGVKLMTGTDSGDLGVFQGYSVHREMALMVKAGLSTWEALTAGTTRPREFLGRPSGIGEGERADFLVLSASPVDDIQNTQAIESVFQNGKEVERAKLLAR